MKRTLLIILIAACLCMSQPLQAFEPTRMYPTDRFIVTVFSDIWQDVPENMELTTIQRGVNISALQDMPLGRSNFSIAAGLEFSSHNMYSNKRYWFNPNSENFDFYPIHHDYDKNKVSLNYIDVPVQFRFRSRGLDRTFRLYAGMKAGYLINAHTKYVGKQAFFDPFDIYIPYDANYNHGSPPTTRTTKIKEHKLENILKYRIGLTAMVGYGSMNLYIYYPLTKVFEDNSAEDMAPFSLGLSLILF